MDLSRFRACFAHYAAVNVECGELRQYGMVMPPIAWLYSISSRLRDGLASRASLSAALRMRSAA